MQSGAETVTNTTGLAFNITQQAYTAANQATSQGWYAPISWAAKTISSVFSWVSSSAYSLVPSVSDLYSPLNIFAVSTLPSELKATNKVKERLLVRPAVTLTYLNGLIGNRTFNASAKEMLTHINHESQTEQKPITEGIQSFIKAIALHQDNLDISEIELKALSAASDDLKINQLTRNQLGKLLVICDKYKKEIRETTQIHSPQLPFYKAKLKLEENSKRKPMLRALLEFAQRNDMDGAISIDSHDVSFLKQCIQNRKTNTPLTDNDLERLIDLYHQHDHEAYAHRAKLGALQSIGDCGYIYLFNVAYNASSINTIKMPTKKMGYLPFVIKGYKAVYQSCTAYYNGSKALGREYLFNGIKDIGVASLLNLLADSVTTNPWINIPLKLSIGSVIAMKYHNIINPKSHILLRKRHQLIKDYLEAIKSGKTEKVAELLELLNTEYDIDPDDMKLMSEVQEQSAKSIKEELQSNLLQGLESLIKETVSNPGKQSSRAGVVSYTQKLQEVCGLDASNAVQMEALCEQAKAKSKVKTDIQQTVETINTIFSYFHLSEIKETLDMFINKQPVEKEVEIKACLSKLKLVDRQSHDEYVLKHEEKTLEVRKDIEAQLDKLIPNAAENKDAIVRLLKALKPLNELVFEYYQKRTLESMAHSLSLLEEQADSKKQSKLATEDEGFTLLDMAPVTVLFSKQSDNTVRRRHQTAHDCDAQSGQQEKKLNKHKSTL